MARLTRRAPTHSVGTRRLFCCSGLSAARNGYHPGEAETQRGGKMKGTHRLRRLLCLALAVGMICTLTLAVGLAAKQRRLAGKLIRLHVVASSDAPDDQARKLLVRDAVLPVAAALTDGCADADAARRRLAAGLPDLFPARRSLHRPACDRRRGERAQLVVRGLPGPLPAGHDGGTGRRSEDRRSDRGRGGSDHRGFRAGTPQIPGPGMAGGAFRVAFTICSQFCRKRFTGF